jgi:hypothetical protein
VINVPISGGRSDDKEAWAAMSPDNADVVNARYLADGSIAKRHGILPYPTLTGVAPKATEGLGHTIAEHDGRLLAITHDGAYAHDEARAVWTSLGRLGPRPAQAKTDPLLRVNNSARQSDMALGVLNGKTVACVVWHDSEADVVSYAFFEVPSDGRPLIPISGPTAIGGSLKRMPKVAAVPGTSKFAICGFANSGSGVYYSNLDIASSYTFPASALLHVNADPPWLTLIGGDDGSAHFWVVTGLTAASSYIYRRKDDFTADGNRTVGKTGPLAAGLITDGTYRIVIAYPDGSIHRTLADCSAAGTTIGPLVTPAASTQVHAATVCQLDSAGQGIVVWSGDGHGSTDAGGLGNFGVDIITISAAGTGVGQTRLGQVRLGGSACWDGSGASPLIPFINMESGDAGSTPFFAGYIARLVWDPGGSTLAGVACVATFGADVATIKGYFQIPTRSAGVANAHLPSLRSPATGRFVMPFGVAVDYIDPLDPTNGIDVLRLTTVGSAALRSVSAAGVRLFQSAAGISSADGIQHAELTPPPVVFADESLGYTGHGYNLTDPSVAFGSTVAFVKLAVRWRDAKGNLHRSIPSTEYTFSFAEKVGAIYNAVRWAFPRPWPMSAGNRGPGYEVEVYQADVSGGTFYLVGTATPLAHPSLLACDYIVPLTTLAPAVGTFTQECVLLLPTPSTAGKAQEWTSLGELQHIPPPPFADVCSTQQRVWGLNAEKGRLEVWPSKLVTDGFAPEFSPDLAIRIPTEGGECVGLAALDDKVVVFKERKVFVIFGDPGNNNGQRSTVQPARLVSGDVGCSNAGSIVEGPFGIAFQASSFSGSARAGIHVIGRDLSISHVGAPAKSICAGVDLGSGTLVPAEKEVRWTLPNLDLLIWSYDVNRWHRHTLRGGLSACVRRGDYSLLVTSADAAYDSDTFGAESTHALSATSSWIKVAGLQGFQRIWILGNLVRWFAGGITVELGFDYEEGFKTSKTWSHSAMSGLIAVGSYAASVYVDVPYQKCEAIRVRITEDPTNNPGRGFEWVGLVLEVGVKSGAFRRYLKKEARK